MKNYILPLAFVSGALLLLPFSVIRAEEEDHDSAPPARNFSDQSSKRPSLSPSNQKKEPRWVIIRNGKKTYLETPKFEWNPAAAKEGPVLIKVVLEEQRMYIYKGGALMGTTDISSGRAPYNTRKGTFKISQKNKDHKSNLYGTVVDKSTGREINSDATPRSRVPDGAEYRPSPMPYFQRLTGSGTGFHAGFVIPRSTASHGCIRLPEQMASNLFELTQLGTKVVVVDSLNDPDPPLHVEPKPAAPANPVVSTPAAAPPVAENPAAQPPAPATVPASASASPTLPAAQ
ncbi:MAG: L,D-transpeptidase family protein [Verrucomicrobiae bacterium]|nr:L,D-transpeptidase family protein [Verrucomicrobiae bacterium]